MFRQFATRIKYPNQVLYENKDRKMIYASYFLLGAQSIFFYSFISTYKLEPDSITLLTTTGAALLVPLGVYYYAKHRITRVELLKNGTVVKLTNTLPFKHTDYYERKWFYTLERTQNNQVSLYFDKKSPFLLSGGDFSPDFNSIFLKKS